MMWWHPKGVYGTHAAKVVAVLCLAGLTCGIWSSASADEAEHSPVQSPTAPLPSDRVENEFSIERVVPGSLRATDLDSVRHVNDRAALQKAMREADILRERRDAGEFEPERRYRAPSNPYEAQRRIQEEYGPDSIITRSASTVAAIAGGVERGSAKSLDGVATVTESIVNRGGDALGFDPIDVPRLKPRISGRRAGVYVSGKW